MTQIFRSVRFNIILFAILAFGAAVGTLVPQVAENPGKVEAWRHLHPYFSRGLEIFSAFDIYHSWWYVALLGLMAFDVVLCKLWNKPPDHGLVELPEEEDLPELPKPAQILGKPYRLERSVSKAPTALAQIVERSLGKRGFHVERHERQGRVCLEAGRHRIQRWGSYVSHVSLVVILLGAGIGGVFGFEEFLPIPVGKFARMQNKPWVLHVDDFKVDYYPGTRNPSLFQSKLRVYENDKLLAEDKIIVNEPLGVGAVNVYQASWGLTGSIRKALLDVNGKPTVLDGVKPLKIPGTPWEARILEFIPDFGLGPNGPFWKSTELKNPALKLGLFRGKNLESTVWAFTFPVPEHAQSGPKMTIVDVDPIPFSGLQVAYNPGYPVILFGALSLLSGLCLLFYTHQRRLWVLLEPHSSGSTSLTIGGWSSRGGRDFEREFQDIVQSWH